MARDRRVSRFHGKFSAFVSDERVGGACRNEALSKRHARISLRSIPLETDAAPAGAVRRPRQPDERHRGQRLQPRLARAWRKAGLRVEVFDASASPLRKFLLAGRGGLNLTHAEPLDLFLNRYGEARARLKPAIAAFPPEALRAWAVDLGEPTFVGSSGRVFPKSFKATPLARGWLARLTRLGVLYRPKRKLIGLGDGARFAGPDGEETRGADVIVLALGGASWPRLGADGGWVKPLARAGVEVTPLAPANMGLHVAWSPTFSERFAGQPIKAARWSLGAASSRAEAIVTARGLEGGAIYALSAAAREAIGREGAAELVVDLKPDQSETALAVRLAGVPGASRATRLAKAGLAPVAAGLMREAGEWPADAAALAARAKACAVLVTGYAGVERAISSAGGVSWAAVDENFMLRTRPGVFIAGEMIDWEAPTGGYLLQACFATGVAAARGALAWAGRA